MLDEVKDKLNVTWDDEDSKIQKIIDNGKKRIEELTGTELDFTTAGLQKDLLLNYCRYDYNNANEFFEENFQKEINRLQLMEASELFASDSNEE